jgi:hypothetical protein
MRCRWHTSEKSFYRNEALLLGLGPNAVRDASGLIRRSAVVRPHHYREKGGLGSRPEQLPVLAIKGNGRGGRSLWLLAL